MPDSDLLLSVLSSSPSAWQVECVETLDSTNAELARRYSSSQWVPRMVLWAEKQTSGMGRLSRKWSSVPYKDITASLVFPSPVPVADTPKLNLLAAIALAETLRENHGVETCVRWPNDVITSKGKLAGILSVYLSGPRAVICGIGLNVNSEPEELHLEPARPGTTLRAETGRETSRERVLGLWILRFEEIWPLAGRENFELLKARFEPLDFYNGRRLRVLVGAGWDREENAARGTLEGLAKGLDESGTLVVEVDGKGLCPISIDDVLVPLT